jgi:hypothetical protein
MSIEGARRCAGRGTTKLHLEPLRRSSWESGRPMALSGGGMGDCWVVRVEGRACEDLKRGLGGDVVPRSVSDGGSSAPKDRWRRGLRPRISGGDGAGSAGGE